MDTKTKQFILDLIDTIKGGVYGRVPLGNAPTDVLNDKDIMMNCMKKDPDGTLEALGDSLKNDFDIAHYAVGRSKEALKYFSKDIRSNEIIIKKAVVRNPESMKYIIKSNISTTSKKGKTVDERSLTLKGVMKKGLSLEVMNDKFKDDEEIVLAAVQQNGMALQFASKKLRDNKKIVIEAVKMVGAGGALQFASDRLRDDKEVVLATIYRKEGRSNIGKVIVSDYASNRLREDIDILFAEVMNDNYRMSYLSNRSKFANNKKLYNKIVEYYTDYNKNYDGDSQFYEYSSRFSNRIFSDFSEKIRTDIDCIISAIKLTDKVDSSIDPIYESIEELKPELLNNKKLMLVYLQKYGSLLSKCNNELKKDKEVVLAACKNSSYAIEYADVSLQNDKKFIIEMVKYDWQALRHCTDAMKSDKDVVISAVRNIHGEGRAALEYAHEKLRADKDVVMALLNGTEVDHIGDYTFEHVSSDLKNDKKFMLEVADTTFSDGIKIGEYVMEWVGTNLKKDKEFIKDVRKIREIKK